MFWSERYTTAASEVLLSLQVFLDILHMYSESKTL